MELVSRVFNYCLKVRYPEVDQMGVVYHGNYLPWLELARTDIINQFGLTYSEMERRGIFVPTTDLNISFKRSAGYDDNIVVLTKVKEMTNIRFSFEYEVRKANFQVTQGGNTLTDEQVEAVQSESDLLVVATSQHLFLNASKRPVRIQREAPDIYELLKNNIPGSFEK